MQRCDNPEPHGPHPMTREQWKPLPPDGEKGVIRETPSMCVGRRAHANVMIGRNG